MTPHWNLEDPKLVELPKVLEQCGHAVVREITRGVLDQTRPDGLPQKQNAMSTIVRKGHDHPVAERRFRFAKESTYLVAAHDRSSVRIGIRNPEDGQVAAYLEENGYHFFGVTAAAEDDAFGILEAYLVKEVKEAFEGRK